MVMNNRAMKRIFGILSCAAVACAISCIQEQTDPSAQGDAMEMTFIGYADEDSGQTDTRTTLHTDGTSVHWSPDDRIMVFSGTTNGVISEKASVQSDPTKAEFTVKTTLADTYHAIYPPYDKATYSSDYDYITAFIPTQQTPVEGSFADGMNLSVAKSEGNSLYFRNAGALLAVKNPTGYAGSIKIVSRDENVKMSGEASISYNEGNPKVVSSEKAVNHVELTSGLHGTKDHIFNCVVYPGTYSQGFDVIFTSSNSPYLKSIYSSATELEVRRNGSYMLFELPEGVFSWNSIAGPTSVTASASGWGQATVSWTWDYVLDGTDPRAGYRVHVRKSGTTEVLQTIDIDSPSTYSRTVTGLTVDTRYDFGVQTRKTSGKDSEIVWAKDIWLYGNVCTPPEPLAIEQISETKVTLTWKDNTGIEKQYMIYKTEISNGQEITNTAILDANTTSYTTSVTEGRTYIFGIQAKANEKTGEYTIENSDKDSEKVCFDPYVALSWKDLQKVDMGENECLAPIEVAVSLDGQQATVTWDCHSGAATGFKVYIRESSEPEWTSGSSYVEVGKDIRTYTFLKVLEYGKAYTLGVQAINSASVSRNSDIVDVTVMAVEPSTGLYDWEKSRTSVPTWSDMTLCYGGDPKRVPYLWDQDRFASHALYTDQNGNTSYLFDAFLAIDFGMGDYTLNYDGESGAYSGRKQEWTQFMNYWFDGTNGLQALDDCIADAARKIGAPATKRYVVFTLPDPVYYSNYTDKSGGTSYWGTYDDGTKADFSTTSGRIKAYKWMIDQVRARFAAKNYQYIELAGFYILSESLSATYNNTYKKWSDVLPAVADYCHNYKEGLCWIPYGYSVSGSGYDSGHNTAIKGWSSYGFDLAVLQPNKYWDYNGSRSWSVTCDTYVNGYGMGMEIEFEGSHGENLGTSSSILTYRKSDGEKNGEAAANKERLREYFTNAKTYGIYGNRPLVLYSGSDGLYELATSTDAEDNELYHELGEFILGAKH